MKKMMGFAIFVVVALTMSISSPAPAQPVQSSSTPVGISLFDPIQWPDRSQSITGVRFNFIYANNRNLTGLDLGLLVPFNKLQGDLSGVQFGLYNGVKGAGGGIQFGALNHVRGDFTGIQFGVGNLNQGLTKGVQFGVYNQSKSMSGLQLGLLNVTDSLNGVQIGIANFKSEIRSTFPSSGPNFFPIFNWSF